MSLRHDCQGCQIFCFEAPLSFLTLFCRKKLSGYQQCAQTEDKTVKTVRQASSTMPSKPLAAKASVFNGCCLQASSCQTICLQAAQSNCFQQQLRQSLRNQISQKMDFTAIFLKCGASSMATMWAWRVHLGFVWTSQAGGELAKEISSTRLRWRRCSLRRHQPLLRQQQGRMVTAPPTSLLPVRVPSS